MPPDDDGPDDNDGPDDSDGPDADPTAGPDDPASFRFEYRPGTIRYGPQCVETLADELAARDVDGALVVTGTTVGTTPAVIDPVREGLGDRFAGLFAETTPDKRFATAVAGVERYRETGADAVLGLGGGSSLDVARTIAVLAGSDRPPDALAAAMAETGDLPIPETVPPLFVVPTTLAGADLSLGGGITAAPANGYVDAFAKGSLWDRRLLPAGAFYDPGLVATTPRGVLARSAMNGFDKGIEALYAGDRSAITDATASRGLRRFAEGLEAFEGDHEAGLPAVVEALPLVQYGISRTDATLLGPIHALAKQVARVGGCSQGVAHAVVAPRVLAAAFDRADGRRRLLAEALGVREVDGGRRSREGERRSRDAATASDPEPDADAGPDLEGDSDAVAAAVVDRVTELRDGLGVPTRLRDVGDLARGDFDEIARRTREHPFAAGGPAALAPADLDYEAILAAAW